MLEAKSYEYRDRLMVRVVQSKVDNEDFEQSDSVVPEAVTHTKALQVPRPSKAALVEKHRSRFIK